MSNSPKPSTRLRHLALEREPAQFAVGEGLQACLLLRGDGLIDGGVLDALEFRRADPPGVEVLARCQQFRWSEQTADHVGVGQFRHAVLLVAASLRFFKGFIALHPVTFTRGFRRAIQPVRYVLSFRCNSMCVECNRMKQAPSSGDRGTELAAHRCLRQGTRSWGVAVRGGCPCTTVHLAERPTPAIMVEIPHRLEHPERNGASR